MRKFKTHKKLPAFTLFESVVSITIITVLIGLGTMIYGNLLDAEKPLAYYQAQNEIDLHFKEIKENKSYLNAQFDHDNFRIEQAVDFYLKNKKLYQITYVVSIADKVILTEHHLIPNLEYDQGVQ